MTPAVVSESIDRRVLGGLVFVDAITGASVVDPLQVTSAQLRVRANRSGVYAIFDAPGFTTLTAQFNPVPATWPAAQSFEVSVQDPSLHYLPRRAQIQAPQSLAAAFNPQPVMLYPATSAVIEPNWAVIRASVTGTGGSGLPWAVVQALRADNSVAATGVTDSRGEALLAVAGLGVQVSSDSSGSVTEMTVPVTVQAWFDPGVLNEPSGWISNPDDILANLSNSALKTGQMTGDIGARQVLFASITISI